MSTAAALTQAGFKVNVRNGQGNDVSPARTCPPWRGFTVTTMCTGTPADESGLLSWAGAGTEVMPRTKTNITAKLIE